MSPDIVVTDGPRLPQMLTSAEVREALQVSPNTLAGFVRSGQLPATKVGNGLRFWPRDVELFLDLGRVQPSG